MHGVRHRRGLADQPLARFVVDQHGPAVLVIVAYQHRLAQAVQKWMAVMPPENLDAVLVDLADRLGEHARPQLFQLGVGQAGTGARRVRLKRRLAFEVSALGAPDVLVKPHGHGRMGLFQGQGPVSRRFVELPVQILAALESGRFVLNGGTDIARAPAFELPERPEKTFDGLGLAVVSPGKYRGDAQFLEHAAQAALRQVHPGKELALERLAIVQVGHPGKLPEAHAGPTQGRGDGLRVLCGQDFPTERIAGRHVVPEHQLHAGALAGLRVQNFEIEHVAVGHHDVADLDLRVVAHDVRAALVHPGLFAFPGVDEFAVVLGYPLFDEPADGDLGTGGKPGRAESFNGLTADFGDIRLVGVSDQGGDDGLVSHSQHRLNAHAAARVGQGQGGAGPAQLQFPAFERLDGHRVAQDVLDLRPDAGTISGEKFVFCRPLARGFGQRLGVETRQVGPGQCPAPLVLGEGYFGCFGGQIGAFVGGQGVQYLGGQGGGQVGLLAPSLT